jgi:hypothetical protein
VRVGFRLSSVAEPLTSLLSVRREAVKDARNIGGLRCIDLPLLKLKNDFAAAFALGGVGYRRFCFA